MKKFFLTVFVVLACVVNADDLVPIQHNSNQPWDRNNPLGRQAGEKVGTTYYYQRLQDNEGNPQNVIFGATWGNANNNQMYSYERVDEYGNNISGWKYENGTFTFTSDYVWTDLASRYDAKENTTNANLGNLVEFGYYKIVDGQPTATHEVMTVGEDGVTKNTVIFKKDEKIGFYTKIQEEVQTNKIDHYEHRVGGKTYTSDSKDYYYDENNNKKNHKGTAVYKTETVTKTLTTTPGAIDGATVVVNNVDTDSRGLEDQYFCLFLGQIDGQKHYEYYLAGLISSDDYDSYEDFYDDIIEQHPDTTITDSNGDPATKPSGQPLPGLLMTLAIGGTAIAGLNKKRKK